ncbi:Reticulocyte-binding protein 2 a like [Actinidia chinensis var. chinensis]|uniref:Reticulocyte-binding protein 2 a like n=1 Tax=Actinidia chinensis var. chinensis TaxID=1590841 RepID=A0A2R6PWE4_ACTCC|nr:Reticulocyte-binding protein 2 a like [Actinidia chinensis var. chinensis]
MEDQCSPLSWGCFYLEEGIEELKHSLLYTTLELETTILSAQEEIARKEEELIHFKDLLTKTIKERDEAQEKCQILKLEKFMLQQQIQHKQGKLDSLPLSMTRNEDEVLKGGESNKGISSSNSNDSPPPPLPPPPPPPIVEKLVVNKSLPENGRFLQAVMEAGPLLQTLLLAGPLPQWQHPPPQLTSLEIPPPPVATPSPPRLLHRDSCVSTNYCFSNKSMVHCEASDSSPKSKYQKVVHQSPLTNG